MKRTTKNVIMALAAVAIFAAGCTKNAASITGTWTSTTMRFVTTTDGTQTRDTTITAIGSYGRTITLASSGAVSLTDAGGTSHGTYQYGGNKLTLIDSSGMNTLVFDVSTLTDHALGLTASDTSTISSQTVIDRVTYNFSR